MIVKDRIRTHPGVPPFRAAGPAVRVVQGGVHRMIADSRRRDSGLTSAVHHLEVGGKSLTGDGAEPVWPEKPTERSE
jgi:hypothetical protein